METWTRVLNQQLWQRTISEYWFLQTTHFRESGFLVEGLIVAVLTMEWPCMALLAAMVRFPVNFGCVLFVDKRNSQMAYFVASPVPDMITDMPSWALAKMRSITKYVKYAFINFYQCAIRARILHDFITGLIRKIATTRDHSPEDDRTNWSYARDWNCKVSVSFSCRR